MHNTNTGHYTGNHMLTHDEEDWGELFLDVGLDDEDADDYSEDDNND